MIKMEIEPAEGFVLLCSLLVGWRLWKILGEGVQRPKGNCVVLTGLHSLAAVPSSKQGVGRGGKSPQHPTRPHGAGCSAGTQGHCLPLASRHGDGLG